MRFQLGAIINRPATNLLSLISAAEDRPWRAEVLAAAAWTLAILVISVRVVVAPRPHNIYLIFARAGRDWLAYRDLYVSYPFRYSPLVAALMGPFSLLPDRLGSVLWRLANAAVYLGALLWWSRSALPYRLSTAQRAWLFILVLPLSVDSLNNGQSNALILGLILAALAASATDRWNQASACTALATLFKIYPISVGLLLAALYPRGFAGRLAAALGAGLALPFILRRPQYVAAQYAAWLRYTRSDVRWDWPWPLAYRDLHLILRILNVPITAESYLVPQLFAAAAIAALCLAAQRTGCSRPRLLTTLLALACCWMLLLGPATEASTYILLGPPLAWAIIEARLEGRSRWVFGSLLFSYGLALAGYVAGWFPERTPVFAYALQPLGALAFLGCVLTMEIRRLFRGKLPAEESGAQPPA